MKAAVPPDRLLVFTVDQGWAPLCRFLDLPGPAAPFPNVNSRAEFQKIKNGMAKGAYVILAGLGVALTALAYGAMRLFG